MMNKILIVGGGAAGISTAASILKRDAQAKITLIDPADQNFYQPGWTMVGAGVFEQSSTAKSMLSVIPKQVTWIKDSVISFLPDQNKIVLKNGEHLLYDALVVCPGIKLNWGAIEGLTETLGKNGVTSNYRYDLAPYTWELVQNLKQGKAIFTQPPMPIKCAGAPQKAMYLSADYWLEQKNLDQISIDFCNAGAALFGVKEYVPALMQYIKRYNVNLCFEEQLIKVDGPNKKAWFKTNHGVVEKTFDMLHAVPPQQAPDCIRNSSLVDEKGWVSVHPNTLQHTTYRNIFALGDVINTTNAKTAAAARKQAPVVATNVIAYLEGSQDFYSYDGYGSCPLTVERGKIVLAEFGYGGKLMPTLPKWLLDGTQPTGLAWFMKAKLLPYIYWNGMLKGHEWFVKPDQKYTK